MPTNNRLRRTNLLRILESLWHIPNPSRADLARELHLDRSTIGLLVDQMIDRGILRQHAEESSGPRGGRPPILLTISPGVAYSLGVELTYPNIRLAAVDLCGSLIGSREIPIQDYGPQAIENLAAETARYRATLDASFKEGGLGLVTLGVGVSGQIADDGRSILISHALHISEPLNVADPLERALQVPVTLLNDAQAGVMREAGLRDKEDLLLIIIEFRPGNAEEDIGIGAGLVMGNKLCHGRAITHLLRSNLNALPSDPALGVEGLGKSLALVANITGIDEIVLGGEVEDILIPLGEIVDRYSKVGRNREETIIRVSHINGGSEAVALGAAYSAMKLLLASHDSSVANFFASL